MEDLKYEPRGKVARLMTAMRARPEQLSWSAQEVANIIEVPKGNVGAYLGNAIINKVVHRRLDGSGGSEFSLTPYPLPPAPPAAAPVAWTPPRMTPPRGGAETGMASEFKLRTDFNIATSEALQKTHAAIEPRPFPNRVLPVETEPEELEEEVPFNAALWADGDLHLFGLLELEGGGHAIAAKDVRLLCRLLHGQGPEA